jgi:hypothetical protein
MNTDLDASVFSRDQLIYVVTSVKQDGWGTLLGPCTATLSREVSPIELATKVLDALRISGRVISDQELQRQGDTLAKITGCVSKRDQNRGLGEVSVSNISGASEQRVFVLQGWYPDGLNRFPFNEKPLNLPGSSNEQELGTKILELLLKSENYSTGGVKATKRAKPNRGKSN